MLEPMRYDTAAFHGAPFFSFTKNDAKSKSYRLLLMMRRTRKQNDASEFPAKISAREPRLRGERCRVGSPFRS